MSDEVDMTDTYYGREQALHERELEATVYCMSQEKRDKLRRKFVLGACLGHGGAWLE